MSTNDDPDPPTILRRCAIHAETLPGWLELYNHPANADEAARARQHLDYLVKAFLRGFRGGLVPHYSAIWRADPKGGCGPDDQEEYGLAFSAACREAAECLGVGERALTPELIKQGRKHVRRAATALRALSVSLDICAGDEYPGETLWIGRAWKMRLWKAAPRQPVRGDRFVTGRNGARPSTHPRA